MGKQKVDRDAPNFNTSKDEAIKTYYQKQLKLSDEEAHEMLEVSKRGLPQTFRLNWTSSSAEAFLRDISTLAECAGETLRQLQWYSALDGAKAYSFNNLNRSSIKRSKELKELKASMVDADNWGAITRQEFVSLIPPRFMDLKSDHVVLDMCASPGSKTNQIMELMNQELTYRKMFPTPDSVRVGVKMAKGALIANDVDIKRLHMLIHQLNRAPSPLYGIQLSDASKFKGLTESFDRILCDVPCCGDGTIRKNFDIWKKWTVKSNLGLCSIQNSILRRGLSLLKVGGRLVYSTCSMSPLQDEAVIYNVLKSCEGSLELIDIHEENKNSTDLKMLKGLKTWVVPTKAEFFDDENSVREIPVPFTPPPEGCPIAEQLPRASRILPHLNDTGGFFICAIRKIASVPWGKKKKVSLPAVNDSNDTSVDTIVETEDEEEEKERSIPVPIKSGDPTRGRQTSEAPFEVLSKDKTTSLESFYGLGKTSTSDIPSQSTLDSLIPETKRLADGVADKGDLRYNDNDEDHGLNFLIKKDTLNKVFIATSEICAIATQNKHGLASSYHAMGAHCFHQIESKINDTDDFRWRLSQGGIKFIAGVMKRRIIFINLQTLAALLTGSTYVFKEDLLHLEKYGGVSNLNSIRVKCNDNGEELFQSGGVVCVVVPPRILPWIDTKPDGYETDTDKFRKDLWMNEGEFGFKSIENLPDGWNDEDDTTKNFGNVLSIAGLITRYGHLKGYCARPLANALFPRFLQGKCFEERGVKRLLE